MLGVISGSNLSRYKYTAAVLCAFLFPLLTFAEGSVKILDQRNLLRAHAVVKSSAEVIIKMGSAIEANPVLVNVDGLAGEKSAQSSSAGEFRFSAVTPGTWRISGLNAKQFPKEVELVPH